MATAISFGDNNSAFQAGIINGTVNLSSGLENPLNRLPHVEDAPFDSFAKQHEPSCLPGTRVDVLDEIYRWAEGQDERCIFWLSGLAGTGKSTIARTVARSYHDKKRLAASFFFSRGSGDDSHAGKFVTSIAAQLIDNMPASRQHICTAIAERRNIASKSLSDQWDHLILHPLSLLEKPALYILVIDALDECDDDDNVGLIVRLLAKARSLAMVRLRVFLTSRPELPIRSSFRQIPDIEHQDFVLHKISPPIIDHDITIFLRHRLGQIARKRCQTVDWPGEEVIRRLCESASGLFIWVATACRFIEEGGQFFADRLHTILSDSCRVDDVSTDGSSTEDSCTDDLPAIQPERQLNRIYLTVLQSPVRKYNKKEKRKWYRLIRETLGAIVLLFSPLSASSLAKLLKVPSESIQQTLYTLHSIFDLPEDHDRPLRLHHPSFRDFLLSKDRCGDAFWVDEKQAHTVLANYCIEIMESLKKDVCEVGAPGTLAAEVESKKVEQYLYPELQYACRYWIRHLAKSNVQLRDDDQVHNFLKAHCLHWLEALGWIGKVSEGIHAIGSLESITLTSNCPSLYAFVHDMKRFMLYSGSVIQQAPLQVHYSALVFAPSRSVVKTQFEECIPQGIKKLLQVDRDWSACLQTLEGHSDSVRSVAFSHNSTRLASASYDGTVKIWDASSGTCLQTLEGHSDSVNSVAFSHDSTRLASASYDGTVKIWDASSGTCLQTLEGHNSYVSSVAFSHDSTRLASASYNGTVKIWDASSGTCLQTLEGHSDSVNSVAFSHNSTQLASASDDGTVKIWDASSGTCLQTLEGYSGLVNSVAFSHDSTRLASASSYGTIKIWDASSGTCLQTLEDHSSSVRSVAFSHDSTRLASASGDDTVKIWDASSGTCLQTLEGHSSLVRSVAFSHDSTRLASASDDETVKIWDASNGTCLQTLEGHSGSVWSVAFSYDSTRLASASSYGTTKIWDASSGTCLQTLKGHSDSVNSVAFSHDSTRLASASGDDTVKIWDASSGTCLQTLEGHSDSVNSVAFSHDSTRLASASGDETVKIWDASSGTCLQTLEGHSSYVSSVAFSHDSTRLASASYNSTVKIWDAGSGTCLQTLEGHSDSVRSVAFSHDSTRLASASDDNTAKIWDASSGTCLQTLEGHNSYVSSVAFSHDSTRLASASSYGTIKIWDASNGTCLQTLEDRSHSDLEAILASLYSHEIVKKSWQPIHQEDISISADRTWICNNAQKLLWLPTEYRPVCTAISGRHAGLGTASGKVWMCHLE
ncbi:putative WD-repeat protein [Phaeosphaeriaceae sp. PMI808]|nr:putative WD-repeat protein [Phaeosphaeriaceae sp. PMI808]